MNIINALMDAQNGRVVDNINEKARELMDAVRKVAAKGKLTLTMTIVPSKLEMGHEVSMVEIDFDVEVKKPTFPPGKAVFFVADNGDLTRNDPRQDDLFKEEKNVRHQ